MVQRGTGGFAAKFEKGGPAADVPFRHGRWSKEEHFRFLEALKMYSKEWRKVQQHVGTRTSTQARSHAQKFLVKLEKKGITLEEFLEGLDLNSVDKEYLMSDLEDDEPPVNNN